MYLTMLLQSAAASGNATGGGNMSFLIMMVLIFVVMWLFMIRPQRKQQKEIEKFRKELKKGDKVVTAGGIYGTIASIEERTVLLKVDGDVKIRVDKASLLKDYSEAAAAPVENKPEEKK